MSFLNCLCIQKQTKASETFDHRNMMGCNKRKQSLKMDVAVYFLEDNINSSLIVYLHSFLEISLIMLCKSSQHHGRFEWLHKQMDKELHRHFKCLWDFCLQASEGQWKDQTWDKYADLCWINRNLHWIWQHQLWLKVKVAPEGGDWKLEKTAIFMMTNILMEKLCDMIIPVKSLMLQFCWCLSQWLQVSKGIHKWKYNCCKKQNALLISYLLFWIKCVNASPTVGFFMSICHCCLSNDDCQKNFKIEVYIAKFCWVWCDAHVCGDTKKQLLLTAMPLLIVSFTGKWITSTWLLE